MTTLTALIHGIGNLLTERAAAGIPPTPRRDPQECPQCGDIFGTPTARVYVTDVDDDRVTLVNEHGFEVWCTHDEFNMYLSRSWGNQESEVARDCVFSGDITKQETTK